MKVLLSSLGCGPRFFGMAMLTIVHCASVSAWRNVTPSFDHTAIDPASISFADESK